MGALPGRLDRRLVLPRGEANDVGGEADEVLDLAIGVAMFIVGSLGAVER